MRPSRVNVYVFMKECSQNPKCNVTNEKYAFTCIMDNLENINWSIEMVHKDYMTVLIIDQANGCIIYYLSWDWRTGYQRQLYIGFAYLMKVLDIEIDIDLDYEYRHRHTVHRCVMEAKSVSQLNASESESASGQKKLN